ncbi:hypothetical protein [Shewanella algae]|uniref:hypothetical protein n=1 Tax=Shewanella algae TaxID=38313 RepID=UPI0038B37354
MRKLLVVSMLMAASSSASAGDFSLFGFGRTYYDCLEDGIKEIHSTDLIGELKRVCRIKYPLETFKLTSDQVANIEGTAVNIRGEMKSSGSLLNFDVQNMKNINASLRVNITNKNDGILLKKFSVAVRASKSDPMKIYTVEVPEKQQFTYGDSYTFYVTTEKPIPENDGWSWALYEVEGYKLH